MTCRKSKCSVSIDAAMSENAVPANRAHNPFELPAHGQSSDLSWMDVVPKRFEIFKWFAKTLAPSTPFRHNQPVANAASSARDHE